MVKLWKQQTMVFASLWPVTLQTTLSYCSDVSVLWMAVASRLLWVPRAAALLAYRCADWRTQSQLSSGRAAGTVIEADGCFGSDSVWVCCGSLHITDWRHVFWCVVSEFSLLLMSISRIWQINKLEFLEIICISVFKNSCFHGSDYEELSMKNQFVLHRRHITSPLQKPAS
jgi:hypothetical protein